MTTKIKKLPETVLEFKRLVGNSIVIFTFLKMDGNERKMTGCFDTTWLPEDKVPKGVREIKNPEIVAVFDIEKSEWRSFNITRLIEIHSITPTFTPTEKPNKKKVAIMEELRGIELQRKALSERVRELKDELAKVEKKEKNWFKEK